LFTLQKPSDRPWILSIAVILVSFGWVENFVEPTSPFGTVIIYSRKIFVDIVERKAY
jgi:hypothetical protein